jgi:hypothetical protein
MDALSQNERKQRGATRAQLEHRAQSLTGPVAQLVAIDRGAGLFAVQGSVSYWVRECSIKPEKTGRCEIKNRSTGCRHVNQDLHLRRNIMRTRFRLPDQLQPGQRVRRRRSLGVILLRRA